MAKRKIETVREQIYYSYANLAMAHTAVDKKQEKYGTFYFMIRAKLAGTKPVFGVGGGVFKSADNGNTWTEFNNGLAMLEINTLETAGWTIFAGTPNGVFRSHSEANGGDWYDASFDLTFTSVNKLHVGYFIDLNAGTQGGGVINGSIWESVTETSDNVISVYPVPSRDIITIDRSLNQHIEINSATIYSTDGRLLLQITDQGNISSIDVSSLTPGVYFMVLKGNEETLVRKFVKQ